MYLFFNDKNKLVLTGGDENFELPGTNVKKIVEVKDYDPDYNYTLKNGKAIKGEKIVIDHTAIKAEIAKTQYRQDRSYLYPPIGDQLDDLYKKGAFSDEMTAKIKKVKDDNPKPE